MRCLYCGNELALLKKLTGGSEFCSEAHRQSYQDEYNRLALSRLLQTPSRTGDISRTGQSGNPRQQEMETPSSSPQAESAGPAAAMPSPRPAEVPAPPAAGFVKSIRPLFPATNENSSPASANAGQLTGLAAVAQNHYGSEPFTQEAGVSMPVWPLEGGKVALATAQVVTIKVTERRWDSSPRRKEKPLEGRDFSRSIPAVEPHLDAIEGRGLSLIKEPIEILAAHVAPTPPKLWHGAPLAFALEPRFAETARLEFSVARESADEAQRQIPRQQPVEETQAVSQPVEDVPSIPAAEALVVEAISPEAAPVAAPNGTMPEYETPRANAELAAVASPAVEPAIAETVVDESAVEVNESPVEPRPAPSLADLWRRSFFEESVALPQPEAAKGAGTQAAKQSEALPERVDLESKPSLELPEPKTAVPLESAAADPVPVELPPAPTPLEAAATASVSPRGALMDLARLQQGITAPFPAETASAPEPAREQVPVEPPAQQMGGDYNATQNGNEVGAPCPSVPAPQRGVAPGKGKLVQSFQSISVTTFRINLPRVSALPMRPKITMGPAPAESKFKLKTSEAKPADTKPADAKPTDTKPSAPVPDADKTVPVKVTTRSERLFPSRTEAKLAPAAAGAGVAETKPSEPKQTGAKLPENKTADDKAAENRTVDSKLTDFKAPDRAADKTPEKAPEKAIEKAPEKTIEKKPEGKPLPLKAAEKKPEVPPSPDARSKDAKTLLSEPKPNDGQADLDRLREAAVAALDGPRLGLESSDIGSPIGSFWKRLPAAAKAAVILVVIAAMAGVAWMMMMNGSPASKTGGPSASEGAGPGIMMGEGGWSTDWAGDAAGSHRGRQIQIYRPSLNMSDYRMEFQGTIESKSIGWVFRASNPRNYYAMKLETIKPGLSPTVVLVKFAVVDGEDSPREQIPLPMPVRLDTLYKVRLEARGPRFTTTIQDQVVDTWTDERLKTGGVGFFSDRGERPQIRGVQISVLNSGQ